MDTSLNNIPLPPWQGTILTWMGGITLVLLLSMILMACLGFYKKRHTVFRLVLGAFVISFLGYSTMGAYFFGGIELKWPLDILAIALVLLCAISSIALICTIFSSPMGIRYFFTWLALLVFSLSAMTFLIMIVPKGQVSANSTGLPPWGTWVGGWSVSQ